MCSMKEVLVVRCTDAKHNLIRLLNYLQSQDISFEESFQAARIK